MTALHPPSPYVLRKPWRKESLSLLHGFEKHLRGKDLPRSQAHLKLKMFDSPFANHRLRAPGMQHIASHHITEQSGQYNIISAVSAHDVGFARNTPCVLRGTVATFHRRCHDKASSSIEFCQYPSLLFEIFYNVQMDSAVLGDRLPEGTQKPLLGPGGPSLQCRH